MKHHLECEAPICALDPNPNYKHEVLWYAGEAVCAKSPFQKFQSKQATINRELKRGTFRNENAFTAHELETRSI